MYFDYDAKSKFKVSFYIEGRIVMSWVQQFFFLTIVYITLYIYVGISDVVCSRCPNQSYSQNTKMGKNPFLRNELLLLAHYDCILMLSSQYQYYHFIYQYHTFFQLGWIKKSLWLNLICFAYSAPINLFIFGLASKISKYLRGWWYLLKIKNVFPYDYLCIRWWMSVCLVMSWVWCVHVFMCEVHLSFPCGYNKQVKWNKIQGGKIKFKVVCKKYIGVILYFQLW